jgi:hypothetical protein
MKPNRPQPPLPPVAAPQAATAAAAVDARKVVTDLTIRAVKGVTRSGRAASLLPQIPAKTDRLAKKNGHFSVTGPMTISRLFVPCPAPLVNFRLFLSHAFFTLVKVILFTLYVEQPAHAAG